MHLALAPMDGVTNCPYRLIVQQVFDRYHAVGDTLGTWTEFMSADGYMINPSRLINHLIYTDAEPDLIAQIYGGNIDTLVQTAIDIDQKYPSFTGIELNIGCPSPKVMACGGGAGMMRDTCRTLEIIREISQNVSLPFSLKTRTGLKASDRDAQFAFVLEAAKYCPMITIHARTFGQSHSGEVDRQFVYDLKRELGDACRVIGNGGLTSYQDCVDRIGNLDGVMIGQAAIGNPWIFTPHTPTIQDRYEVARDHLDLLCAYSQYMTQTRALFPEESDQLALNRQHLHGIKKYDPDSDERSDLPSIARHDYVFPMPTMDVLSGYIADIRSGRLIPDDRKAIIEYRKYILGYIRSIPHLKDLKQQIATSTTYESMRACVAAIVG